MCLSSHIRFTNQKLYLPHTCLLSYIYKCIGFWTSTCSCSKGKDSPICLPGCQSSGLYGYPLSALYLLVIAPLLIIITILHGSCSPDMLSDIAPSHALQQQNKILSTLKVAPTIKIVATAVVHPRPIQFAVNPCQSFQIIQNRLCDSRLRVQRPWCCLFAFFWLADSQAVAQYNCCIRYCCS